METKENLKTLGNPIGKEASGYRAAAICKSTWQTQRGMIGRNVLASGLYLSGDSARLRQTRCALRY
jgi:hypothetical protein